MLIFLLCTPITQHADGAGIIGVVGYDHAAFTVSAQVFARVKTETAHVTHTADSSAFILRTVSLGGIFNHHQTMALGNFQNRIHICRLSVKMHGDNGFGLVGDGAFYSLYVNREGTRINVHKYRFGARVVNRRHRRHKGKGDGNHFVIDINSGREQGKM